MNGTQTNSEGRSKANSPTEADPVYRVTVKFEQFAHAIDAELEALAEANGAERLDALLNGVSLGSVREQIQEHFSSVSCQLVELEDNGIRQAWARGELSAPTSRPCSGGHAPATQREQTQTDLQVMHALDRMDLDLGRMRVELTGTRLADRVDADALKERSELIASLRTARQELNQLRSLIADEFTGDRYLSDRGDDEFESAPTSDSSSEPQSSASESQTPGDAPQTERDALAELFHAASQLGELRDKLDSLTLPEVAGDDTIEAFTALKKHVSDSSDHAKTAALRIGLDFQGGNG